MSFKLPPLPFDLEALEPHMSRRTLEYHHGKHHKTYVETLNQLIQGTAYEPNSLEDIILSSYEKSQENGADKSHDKSRDRKVYNNAAQAWNHAFFWNCLTGSAVSPSRELERQIAEGFDSMDDFRAEFSSRCKDLFGSGWVWLTRDRQGNLHIRGMSNAGTPMIFYDEVPLLTCDVWEHAYYLDYQNERLKFVENFWSIVNWKFVESNLIQPALEPA